jgi:transcription initiation factor TFIIIB Brf1 subunit/transcription initiation factor TFIIB
VVWCVSKRRVVPQRFADKCPECGSANLVHDYDTGETVCGDCGLVLHDQMMDKGPEWRAFTQEEKESRSRVGIPTSFSVHDKGLSTASLVDKKDVARCYRLLLRELGVQMPIADPLTYISKIAERTGISGRTQGLAIQILSDAKRRRAAAGKDPMGLAAAALYLACLQNNEKKTQKDIAEAAGVTEVTVRNRYKSLKRQLGLAIPD